MATIQDIAKRANVSKSTVSRVLNNSSIVNEKTRQAVLDAMEALNYRPNVVARSLAGGQSMTIGVLTQNIGSPYYDTINQGVISGLQGSGYWPIFVDGQWKLTAQETAVDTLLDRRVDGLLLVGGDLPIEKINDINREVPTLVVGRHLPGWESRSVYLDNFEAGREVVDALIEHGHKQIAIVRGPRTQQDSVSRFEGHMSGLRHAGLEQSEELIFDGDFTAEAGIAAVDHWVASKSAFTAIVCSNDLCAFGVRLALSRHSMSVPEQVSVFGFDDQLEAAYMTPPLSTVRQPAFPMGEAAGQAILKLIADEEFSLPQLKTEVVLRESVARLT